MKKYAVLGVGSLHGYSCIDELPGQESDRYYGDDEGLPLWTDGVGPLTRVWDEEYDAEQYAVDQEQHWSRVYRGQRFVVVPVEHEFYIRVIDATDQLT